MKIILGIILLAIGALNLFLPYYVWIINDSWKMDSKSEPSGGYLLYIRIVGGVAMAVGLVLLLVGIFGPKEKPVTVEDVINSPQVEVTTGYRTDEPQNTKASPETENSTPKR